MKRLVISLLCINLFTGLLFSNEIGRQELVNTIARILKVEYEKYSDASPMEKFVLKMGRNAFFDSIDVWKIRHEEIADMQIHLHPRLQHMVDVGYENLPAELAHDLEAKLKSLTRLGYYNLELYREATARYCSENEVPVSQITIETIDDAITEPAYYLRKIELYHEEDILKNEIRTILDHKSLNFKLGLYTFAFDFFNKIRKEIIAKDIARMQARILDEGGEIPQPDWE